MIIRQEANAILEKIKEIRPIKAFKNITQESEGYKFVLCYLCEAKEEIYASHLSKIMNISRARISVMLEKLLDKKLIEKKPSAFDARKEVISITNLGKKEVEIKKIELESKIIKVIDKLGYEKMMDFLNTLKEIKYIFDK